MLNGRTPLLALAVLAITGCGGGGDAATSTSAGAKAPAGSVTTGTTGGSTTPASPSKPALIKLERAVGQRLVTGYHGAKPSASVLRSVRSGHVGGVILFAENVPTLDAARAAVKQLKHAAVAGHHPDLLIMVDQEGGDVKRLATLPPDLSPAQMGASAGPEARAGREGEATAKALRKLGVNVDLAPVADVTASSTSFLGTRAFSHVPKVVARGACGFAAGLTRGGVAGSLKHFPGLGRATRNTDLEPVRVTAGAKDLRADLAAYKRCAKRVPLVMLSSASYPALGIDAPAVLSPRAYHVLAETGFKGITISDAFDTPAIVNQKRPALTALKVGADLLLYGPDEAGAQGAYSRLLGDAEAGRLPRAALQRTAERLLAFKARLRAGLKG